MVEQCVPPSGYLCVPDIGELRRVPIAAREPHDIATIPCRHLLIKDGLDRLLRVRITASFGGQLRAGESNDDCDKCKDLSNLGENSGLWPLCHLSLRVDIYGSDW